MRLGHRRALRHLAAARRARRTLRLREPLRRAVAAERVACAGGGPTRRARGGAGVGSSGEPARARGRRAKPQLSTMGSSSQSLQTLQLSASRNRRETSGISLRQSSMGVASICDDEEAVRRRLIAAIVQRCRCSLCASEWSSRRRGSSSDAWRCVRCGRVERRVRARSVSLFARAVHQSGLQNDRPFPVDAAALKGLPAPMEASTTIGAVLQISDLSL